MLLNPRHHLVDVAELGLLTGCGHHANAAAGADGGAGEEHIGTVAQRQFAFQRVGGFIHHRRLAGENRFFNPQIMALNQAHIGRDAVARAQNHDIARHQVAGGNGFMLAAALHARVAGEHIADALQRFFGVALLDMADQGVDHRDAQDDERIDPVAHDRGERGGGQQDKNQDVVKMGKEAQPGRLAFFLRQGVGAEGLQTLGGLGGAEAVDVAFFLRQHRINRLLICAAWRDIP